MVGAGRPDTACPLRRGHLDGARGPKSALVGVWIHDFQLVTGTVNGHGLRKASSEPWGAGKQPRVKSKSPAEVRRIHSV